MKSRFPEIVLICLISFLIYLGYCKISKLEKDKKAEVQLENSKLATDSSLELLEKGTINYTYYFIFKDKKTEKRYLKFNGPGALIEL